MFCQDVSGPWELEEPKGLKTSLNPSCLAPVLLFRDSCTAGPDRSFYKPARTRDI